MVAKIRYARGIHFGKNSDHETMMVDSYSIKPLASSDKESLLDMLRASKGHGWRSHTYPVIDDQMTDLGDFGDGHSIQFAMPLKERIKTARDKVWRNPTDPQKRAGNYGMGHAYVQGLDVSIETPKGTERTGTNPDTGRRWKSIMPWDYGYLRRTRPGADGEPVDVFLGPDLESEIVFVVDQVSSANVFDEHKAMIGWKSKEKARDAYRSAYPSGWRVGPITAMTMENFRAWLKDGGNQDPAADAKEAYKFAKDKPGERWITIGANKSAPKGKRGGTPVKILGDHIVAGPPGMVDRHLGHMGEGKENRKHDKERTDRQRSWMSRQYAHAKRRRDAKKEGMDPNQVEEAFGWLKNQDKEELELHNNMLKDAKKRLGIGARKIRSVASKGGDAESLRGSRIDEIGDEMANSPEYRHLFDQDDQPGDQLFRMLAEGKREPKDPGEMWGEAASLVREHQGMAGDQEDVDAGGDDGRGEEDEWAAVGAGNKSDEEYGDVVPFTRGEWAEFFAAYRQQTMFDGPKSKTGGGSHKILWDESKHPRADDGKFGEGAGEAKKEEENGDDIEVKESNKRTVTTKQHGYGTIDIDNEFGEGAGSQNVDIPPGEYESGYDDESESYFVVINGKKAWVPYDPSSWEEEAEDLVDFGSLGNGESHSVEPSRADEVIQHLKDGGEAFYVAVGTNRRYVLNKEELEKRENNGSWLIKHDNDGNYRVNHGSKSISLVPGQLNIVGMEKKESSEKPYPKEHDKLEPVAEPEPQPEPENVTHPRPEDDKFEAGHKDKEKQSAIPGFEDELLEQEKIRRAELERKKRKEETGNESQHNLFDTSGLPGQMDLFEGEDDTVKEDGAEDRERLRYEDWKNNRREKDSDKENPRDQEDHEDTPKVRGKNEWQNKKHMGTLEYTPKEAVEAWIESHDDPGFIRRRQTVVDWARRLTKRLKGWKTSEELTVKDREGRKDVERNSDTLKELLGTGHVQIAWDNVGNPYYAWGNEELPDWLTTSKDNDVMADLPERQHFAKVETVDNSLVPDPDDRILYSMIAGVLDRSAALEEAEDS